MTDKKRELKRELKEVYDLVLTNKESIQLMRILNESIMRVFLEDGVLMYVKRQEDREHVTGYLFNVKAILFLASIFDLEKYLP